MINIINFDFFSYSASNQTQSAEKTGRKLGNQVIRKGYMSIHNLGMLKGGAKDYWFVLTSESLSWFKDEEVKCLVDKISIENVHILYTVVLGHFK